MAPRPRLRQALEHQHPAAFGPAGAVGPGREGLAAAVARKPALTAELDEQARCGEDRRTADERPRALATTQGLQRQVDGDERGRAGRIDRQGRSLETKGIGDSTRGDRGCAAGLDVAFVVAVGLDELTVVRARDPDEDPGLAIFRRLGRDPSRLEGTPGELEQEPLLLIHDPSLARADAEQAGVEARGIGQEAADARDRFAAGVGVGVVEVLGPTPVRGKGANRVPSCEHEVPKLLRVFDLTREAASHPDDRDRVLAGFPLPSSVGLDRSVLAESTESLGDPHRQGRRGRMVEHGGHGQTQLAPGLETIAQLDSHQRVDAGRSQVAVHDDPLGSGEAEHTGDLGSNQGLAGG